MSNSEAAYCLAGIIFGMIFMIVVNVDNKNKGDEVRDAVSVCEKELPRHLHCKPVYSAIPEDNK